MNPLRAASVFFLLAALSCSIPRKEKGPEPFLPPPSSGESTIEELLARGQADSVLSILEKKMHLAESPNDLFRNGRALRLRGRLPEALASFQRAAIADSSLRGKALSEILSIQLEQGALREAGATLRELGASPEEKAFLSFLESWEGESCRVSGDLTAVLPFVGEGSMRVPQIECRVEGQGSIPLVLDTGATFCIISQSLAKRLGLFARVTRGIVLDLEGKPVDADYGVIGRMELGGIRVENVPVVIVEDEALSLRLFRLHPVFRAQGAIGMGLLRRLRTTLDFPARRVEFSRLVSENSRGLALLSTGLNLYAPVDSVPAQGADNAADTRMYLRVDTGSNQSAVTKAALRRWNLESLVRPRVQFIGGAQGWGASLHEVELRGLRLGSYRWEPVRLPVAELSDESGLEVGGVIGVDLLQPFRITIDPQWMSASLEKR